MGYIYALICPIINEIRYIGQTEKELNKRLKEHISELKKKIKANKKLTHKQNWLNSLVSQNLINKLKIELIEECDNLNEREVYWISEYRKTHRLTNLSDGGRGVIGYKHTEETKQLLREMFLGEKGPFYGKKHTDAVKEQQSKVKMGAGNPMYGTRYTRSEEVIEKSRIAMINSENFQESRKSKEYKKKISDLKSIPVLVLNLDLSIFKEFKNSTECAEYFQCTRGNIKAAIRNSYKINKQFLVVRKENYYEGFVI